MLFLCVIVAASIVGMAQSTSSTSRTGAASPATRYFQLTLVLRYSASADGPPAPGTQSITTELAVREDRPGSGSCKTRMGSQVPVVMEGKTKYIDLGTSFDCNNVHVEGNGLALSIILETSRVTQMIRLKDGNGVETEEPVINQRKMELSVKLPLDTPKVVFDSGVAAKEHPLKALQPLQPQQPMLNGANAAPANLMMQEPTIQVEMTATELK